MKLKTVLAAGAILTGGALSGAIEIPTEGLLFDLDASVPSTLQKDDSGCVTNWLSARTDESFRCVNDVGAVFDPAAFGGRGALLFGRNMGDTERRPTRYLHDGNLRNQTVFMVLHWSPTKSGTPNMGEIYGQKDTDSGIRSTYYNCMYTWGDSLLKDCVTWYNDVKQTKRSAAFGNDTIPASISDVGKEPYVVCAVMTNDAVAAQTGYNNGTYPPQLGGYSQYSNASGKRYFVGHMAEVIVYDRQLSDDEIDDVSHKLMHKWLGTDPRPEYLKLTVEGSEGPYGSPVPAYGKYMENEFGETFSIAECLSTDTDGKRIVTAEKTADQRSIYGGYEVLDAAGNVLKASDVDESFTFAAGEPVTVRWIVQREYRVAVTAGANGQVAAAGGTPGSSAEIWQFAGGKSSFQAIPVEGYDLWGWTDSTGAIVSRELTLPVDHGIAAYTAVFKKVVYVTPTGTGDGSSWATAANAKAALEAATGDEIFWMKKGDYAVAPDAPITVTSATTVYGGFEGTEAVRGEFAAKSVVHSGNTNLLLTATSGLYGFSHVCISNALYNGLVKTGTTSSAAFEDCEILENGLVPASVLGTSYGLIGRGMLLRGASTATLELRNCLFRGNTDVRATANKDCSGYAAHITSFKKATIVGCSFIDNGQQRGATSAMGRDNSKGVVYIATTPTEMSDCLFGGNRGAANNSGTGEGGALYFNGNCSGSTVTHCRFVGNAVHGTANYAGSGNVLLNLNAKGDTIRFDHCTFAYNLAARGKTAGLNVATGTAVIRNSIFWGNVINAENGTASDLITSGGNGVIDLDYSLLAANEDGYRRQISGTLTIGDHMTWGDPLFASSAADFLAQVNPGSDCPEKKLPAMSGQFIFTNYLAAAALDVHLRSGKGRWNGAEWVKDAEFSPAIDKGEGDYALEPDPNGERANLGAWGATAEASMTSLAKPEISSAELVNGSDYTRPNLQLALAEGDAYSATVTICMGATAPDDDADWDRIATFPVTVSPGADVEWPVKWYFESGSTVWWKVLVSTDRDTVTANGSLAIEGENPPGWGLGGGKGVIHVKAGATGSGEGDSWVDAVPTINDAMGLVTSTRTNVWIAGDVSPAIAGRTFSVPVQIRGGFAGTECAATDRPEGTRSLLDAELSSANCLTFTHASGMTLVERVNLTRASATAISKTGAGSLTLSECRSYRNGPLNTGYSILGRGGNLSGSASSSVLVLNGCSFDGNWYRGGVSGTDDYFDQSGTGLRVNDFKRVEMTDVLFATNGVEKTGCSRNAYQGAALYLQNAPVVARNVRFIGNRGTCHGNYDDSYSKVTGSIVWMGGNCGGSVFSNCLWLANQSPANGDATFVSMRPGAVVIALGSASRTVAFDSCTFAYNLSGSTCAGICVDVGAVTVRNSILWGNTCGAHHAKGIDLYCASGKATLDVDYTLLGDLPDVSYCGVFDGLVFDDQVTLGEHMVSGDPRFVTGTNAVISCMERTSSTVKTTEPGIPLLQPDGQICYGNDTTPFMDFNVHVKRRSPAIDAGFGEWQNEPEPNGHVRNLGYYGNTPWATLSPTGLLLFVK